MDNPNVSQVNINIDSRIAAHPYLDYIITFTYNTYRLEQDAKGNMVKVHGRAGVENTTKLLRGNQTGNFNTNLFFEPGEYLDGYVKMKVELKAVDDVDSIIDREYTGRPASFVQTARRIVKGRPGIDIDDALFDASSGNINIILQSKAAIKIVSIQPDSPSQPIGSYFQREKFDPKKGHYFKHRCLESYVKILSDRVLTNTTKNNNIKIICTYDTCYYYMIDGNSIKEPEKKDVKKEFILSDSSSLCKLGLPKKEFFDGPVKIEVWTRHFDNDDFPWVKQIGDAKLELKQSDRHKGLYLCDVILEGTTAFDGHVYFAEDSPSKPIGQYYQKDDNLNEKEYFLVDILMESSTLENEKNVKVKLTFTTCIHTIDKNGNTIENPGRTIELEELYTEDHKRHHRFYIHLNKGESIDEPVKLQAWARFCEKDDYPWVRNIDDALLDASSGKIEIILTGSTVEGIYDTPEVCLSKDSPSKPIGSYYQNDSSDTSINCYPDSYYERDDKRRKAIREGLRSVYVDAKTVLLNDSLYNEARAADESFVVSSGQCYQLTNVNKPINQESKDVVGKDIGGIYPGSIVIADKNLSEGNPIPLANVTRSQTQIFGTFFSGKGTLKTVDASEAGKVHDTIGVMLRELFAGSQYQPAGGFNFVEDIYSSKYDMMFKMGIDATFCGSNVKVNATINNNESTFVHDTMLRQSFFTVRLNDNYRDDISKLFGDNETWENIKKQCTINGKVQPLAIITSVTYGRNVHYLKEFSTKSFTYNGDQSHTGHGVDVSLKQEIAKSSEATKAQIVSVGASNAGFQILKGDKTTSEIHDALDATSVFGPGNQGAPIAYTIELISGEAPGTIISPTFNGNYVVSEYKRCPSSVSVKVLMKAWTLGDQGNVRLTFKFDTFTLAKDSNGNYYKGPGRKGVTWDHRYADHNYYDNGELPLEPNEYVDGYVKMKIESRPHNAAGWETHQDFASIDASSGIIDLTITGTSRLGASDKPHIDDSSTTKYI